MHKEKRLHVWSKAPQEPVSCSNKKSSGRGEHWRGQPGILFEHVAMLQFLAFHISHFSVIDVVLLLGAKRVHVLLNEFGLSGSLEPGPSQKRK